CPWCKNEDVFSGKTVRWEWYSFKNQKTYDLIDTPLKNPDGSISKLEILRDITEYKRAEEQIRQQSEFLSLVVEAIPHPFYVVDAFDYTIKIANSATHISPLPKDTTCYALTHKSDRPCESVVHPCPLEIVRETKQPATVEHLHYDKDGRPRNVEIHAYPIFDSEGNVIQMIESLLDITKRKQAEKERKRLIGSLEAALANITIGLYRSTPDGHILLANPTLVKMLGYSSFNKLAERNLEKVGFAPSYERKIFIEQIERKGEVKDLESAWLRRNGSTIYVRESARKVQDTNGKTLYYDGTVEDITKRKQAEDDLKKSEEKYRKFFMSDLTGDYLSTYEGKIIDCNPQFLKIFGFKSIEQAQKHDTSKLYKSKSIREKFLKKLEKNKVLFDEQSEQRKINGQKIIIRENVSGEFDENGKLINIRGYLYDVTKRVKAEREVRKLSTAIEQSPVSIVITDTDGIIEYVNPTFEKITGYSLKESVGQKSNVLKSGVTPESEYHELWKTITEGKIWTGEFLNKKKNGELYWESATISPVKDKNDNITNYLAVKEDITEQKNIISELMDREEKYRTLTQNLN
ncbi:MAG: PAS domain S-box protein, partial [Candidatus Heimdallarchaeota archaeon]|nr:PAS domain S-box protein [Candidatus Heimdallarchaeota archaeon]